MWDRFRSPISLVFGLILFLIGGIPILNSIGDIGFSIPDLPLILFYIILTVAGVYMIIHGLMEIMGMFSKMGSLTTFIGIIATVVGIIKLLNSLGVIGFELGFITGFVVNALFLLIGIMLIIGAFFM